MLKLKSTGEVIYDASFIMPDQWVNDRVSEQIRQKYPINEELKCLRLGATDANNPDFVAYNAHVEMCRQWGREQKAIYNQRASDVEEFKAEMDAIPME